MNVTDVAGVIGLDSPSRYNKEFCIVSSRGEIEIWTDSPERVDKLLPNLRFRSLHSGREGTKI